MLVWDAPGTDGVLKKGIHTGFKKIKILTPHGQARSPKLAAKKLQTAFILPS
jgi:hypothetical protein